MLKSTFGKAKNKITDAIHSSQPYTTKINEWTAAKPFEKLPGPSKYQLVREFLPGGTCYKKSFVDFSHQLRSQYGNIFLLPSLFGKRPVVFSYDPKDFQQVFRTEGIHPKRRGFDIVKYHREVLRKDFFKHATGLVPAEGESWSKFRSAVNPVLMNPKGIKVYIPKTDQVAKRFVDCIRRIRDPNTLEVPGNFEQYMKYCIFDCIGLIALDTDLNMLQNSKANPRAKLILDDMDEFFQLLLELDFQPSMWKFIPTPKYRKMINLLDTTIELTMEYVEEAMDRLRTVGRDKLESDKSMLERLISRDPLIAKTMAMDMFLSGVETTTSSLAACFICLAQNPQEQTNLRQELLSCLLHKESCLTQQNMHNLPYLRACIKESMRLYPTAPGYFRTTGQDVVLSGYRIPASTDVTMPAQLLLRDAKYFDQPEKFLPQRWLRSPCLAETVRCDSITKGDPFVYQPFGFGPRICVGKRIVDLQLETLLSRLIRNFKIELDYPANDMFRTNIINVLAKPLRLKFTDLQY